MKKLRRFLIRFFLLGFLLIAAAIFLLELYYRDNFPVNTWINGVYCTGKSVEEVNQELSARAEAPVVNIVDEAGNVYPLDLAGISYVADYTEALERFIHQQNPLSWLENIMLQRSHELLPKPIFDEEQLRQLLEELEPVRREAGKEAEIRIFFSDADGWVLDNGLEHRLDTELLFQQVLESVADGSHEVDMAQSGCIYDLSPTAWQMTQLALWEKVDAFQQCGIVYDMGDQMMSLQGGILGSFLAVDPSTGLPFLDEAGEPVADPERIRAFIGQLAEEYDTYEKEISFQSTRGDVVQVPGNGTYGTTIDQEAEFKYLRLALEENREEVHIPAYIRQGLVRGKNDIGDTYIEVDMTQQKMYYYVDGEMVIETDIVTGYTGGRRGTPQGVNFVYSKQRNRVLRGPGYASPVKYWVPVKGAIGIHDASWRSEFGGEIYKTNGSHGCINTPTEVMAQLYEQVEIGTPVVMFY
ncbi:MAG: L,D-transpeptidase/peptidoglycan binding protein [Lachnospiraceae bacterium]|nr:L,D-transpeptidase/peptidoglycan binding protein [Lachnospiraceae bacterium]